jgi:hypothetical protein
MASKERNTALIAKAKTFTNVPWCSDYEKMISGMLYDPVVPELLAGRLRARRLTTKYNTYFPDDASVESLTQDRESMLKEIIGTLGPRAFIEPPFQVDYGCNISIGADFYANFK